MRNKFMIYEEERASGNGEMEEQKEVKLIEYTIYMAYNN